MSRTYEALKKAEAERQGPFSSPLDNITVEPREAPHFFREGGVPNRLEYEKIRMWLTNSPAREKRVQTAMVVGCRSNTGITTTASLLAATLAESRKSRVLLIDSNFRTPALNMVFQVKKNGGFSEVVSEGLPFDSHLQATNRQNLFVLTTGQIPSYPADIFEGEEINQLIAQLKQQFDFVIFDASPLLEFPDSYSLAPKVDGVILVVEAERTPIEEAQTVKRNLEQVGAKILGVVLNRQKDYTPAFLRKFMG